MIRYNEKTNRRYDDSEQRIKYFRYISHQGMLVCPCCGNTKVYDSWEDAKCPANEYPNWDGISCETVSPKTVRFNRVILGLFPVFIELHVYRYRCRKCKATWESNPFPYYQTELWKLDKYGIKLSNDIGYAENAASVFANLDFKPAIEPLTISQCY